MNLGWKKLRRHAERLAGSRPGEEGNPDAEMWMSRLAKAIRAGELPARRQGAAGDYLAVWREVERWFRVQWGPYVDGGWFKLRRHAERLAGVERGEKSPDVDFWLKRIEKAIVRGKLVALRRRSSGDYIATREEVDRWFESEYPAV